MSETIRVELPCRRDADDLAEFLAGLGLAGSVTSANEHCELEVGYAVDTDTLKGVKTAFRSGCSSVVLVDEAAEAIAAVDMAAGR
jgi:hypothetical protein